MCRHGKAHGVEPDEEWPAEKDWPECDKCGAVLGPDDIGVCRDCRLGEPDPPPRSMEDLGETRCPEGCRVEPDGTCPHGYRSRGLRLGMV